jgi:hypothetical protein
MRARIKEHAGRLGLSTISTLIFVGACASFPRDIAQGMLNGWAPPSAAAGRQLMDEYGTPDEIGRNRLTWNRRGAWKRTVVWNRKPIALAPVDLAVIKQTIDYPLTSEQARTLTGFSACLEVDLERGELSSRAGREEINFLLLNLAGEIVRGERTVAEAQEMFYRQLDLAASGESATYMNGLVIPAGS